MTDRTSYQYSLLPEGIDSSWSAATVRGESLKDVLEWEVRRTPTVLGIRRGGLTTFNTLAKKISCDLDIIIPRWLNDPGNKVQFIGTVLEDGATFLDEELADELYTSGD